MSIPVSSLLNDSRIVTVNQKIKRAPNAFTKSSEFRCLNEPSFLHWPPVNESGTGVTHLGRALYVHLLNIGLLVNDESRPLFGVAKSYHCMLEFELEKHQIILKLTYQFKEEELPIGLTVTKEQLIDYLNQKLLGLKVNLLVERKIRVLLKLIRYECFIDGLELDME